MKHVEILSVKNALELTGWYGIKYILKVDNSMKAVRILVGPEHTEAPVIEYGMRDCRTLRYTFLNYYTDSTELYIARDWYNE